MADPNLSALFPGHALGPAAKTMPLQLLNDLAQPFTSARSASSIASSMAGSSGRASAGLVTKPSESRPSSTREGF